MYGVVIKPASQIIQELVLNMRWVLWPVLYLYYIVISALCWLELYMELINLYLFMIEILNHLCHSVISEHFSPCCRRWSFFTMFAKPTSVSYHEPHESKAHLHNPSLYNSLHPLDHLTVGTYWILILYLKSYKDMC